MKSNRFFQTCFIILIIFLVGCSKPTPTPEELADNLEVQFSEGPEIQIYGHVQGIIRNTTSYCFVFPPDLGIKLFEDHAGNLFEIGNYTKYIGKDPIYLMPIGDINDFISISFDPDVTSLAISEQTSFYAEITGHLCDDDSVIITKKIPFVIVP